MKMKNNTVSLRLDDETLAVLDSLSRHGGAVGRSGVIRRVLWFARTHRFDYAAYCRDLDNRPNV